MEANPLQELKKILRGNPSLPDVLDFAMGAIGEGLDPLKMQEIGRSILAGGEFPNVSGILQDLISVCEDDESDDSDSSVEILNSGEIRATEVNDMAELKWGKADEMKIDAGGENSVLYSPTRVCSSFEAVDELKLEGDKCLKKNNWSGAVDYYTRAIGIAPRNEKLHANRSFAYLELSDYKRSISDIGCQNDYISETELVWRISEKNRSDEERRASCI